MAIHIVPFNPILSDSVMIEVQFSGCKLEPPFINLSGNTFNIVLTPAPACGTPPAGFWQFPIGKLAAATYTVNATGGIPETQSTTFAVAAQDGGPANIPTVEPLGLVLIAA